MTQTERYWKVIKGTLEICKKQSDHENWILLHFTCSHKIVKPNGVENTGVQFAGVYGAAGRRRRVEAAPGPKRRGQIVMEPIYLGPKFSKIHAELAKLWIMRW